MNSYDNCWFTPYMVSYQQDFEIKSSISEDLNDIDENWEKVIIEMNPGQYFTVYDSESDSYWIGDTEEYLQFDFTDFRYWEPPLEWIRQEIKWSSILINIDSNRLNGQTRDISWLKIPDFRNHWGLCRMSQKIPLSRL